MISELAKVALPQGDSGAIEETAKLLAAAENPVLIVDRMVRTQAGMDRLVKLAELLQCPVVDQAGRSLTPSAESFIPSKRGRVPGRRDRRHRAQRLLGLAAFVQRSHRAQGTRTRALQAGNEACQPRRARPLHEGELPGVPALRRGRRSHHRRRRGKSAGAHRCGEAGNRSRAQSSLRGTRQEARRRQAPTGRAVQVRCHHRMGLQRGQFTGEPVKRVVQRFFLFWRHGCSAPRNSSACKCKSLRCSRKCRFSYIDTSPALSARRHLTAALRYSARPPQRPSRSHLGYQIHQTYCLPTSSEPPPPPSVACCAHQVQSFDLSQTFWCHGFNEQIFGADEQVPKGGCGPCPKNALWTRELCGRRSSEHLAH